MIIANVGDTGIDEIIDGVKQHRLVADRHQLFCAGVRERAQARAFAAGENEPFHVDLSSFE